MKLVVGLGNYGKEYERTYHNIGFLALDAVAERFNAPDFTKKNNALVSDALSGERRALLVKPLTYMNLSGDAVAYFANYYKIAPKDILVLYDDIELAVGTVRARLSGSAGTHNGMRDIVSKLGTTDFARVRIGIGFKPNYMDLADYVLSKITATDTKKLDDVFGVAVDFVDKWLSGIAWQEQTVKV